MRCACAGTDGKAAQPDNRKIKAAVSKMLTAQFGDWKELTIKKVRKQLEAQFGVSLRPKKEFIRQAVYDCMGSIEKRAAILSPALASLLGTEPKLPR